MKIQEAVFNSHQPGMRTIARHEQGRRNKFGEEETLIMTDATGRRSPELSMASTVVADGAAISTDLDGEVVILDTNKGVYYGLDAVGASIWNLLQRPATLGEVRDALLREYDVDPATCERDLMALIRKLSVNSLVNIQ